MNHQFNLIAVSKFGIESITANELKKLGYTDLNVETGRINFKGDLNTIAKTNMWLRTAERILINVGEFKAISFEELFENVKSLPWEEWIPRNGEFPVTAKSVKSQLFSLSDCQSIAKKAIVERLKSVYVSTAKSKASVNDNISEFRFPEDGPKYKINVGILNDIVTMTIDTSGDGLHKRGYRILTGGAPIKETLASAMIQLTKWKYDRVLVDPFCGTGTIPIEAAMWELNIAPGFKREFICEKWIQFCEDSNKDIWKCAREETHDLIRKDKGILKIQGTDIDENSLSMARYHAKQAGVEAHIHFQKRDMLELKSHYKYGFVITNPPYGERLGEEQDIIKLYKEMGETFKKLDTWSFYIITSNKDFEKYFNRRADKKRKLYNGMLECDYYQFYGPRPSFRERELLPI